MSCEGCSPDNAAYTGFFGRLKTEMFFARDRLSTRIEEFVVAVDAYVCWYDEARIKSSLGLFNPAQHRRRLGIAAQPVQVLVRIPVPCEAIVLTKCSWPRGVDEAFLWLFSRGCLGLMVWRENLHLPRLLQVNNLLGNDS